MDTISLDYAMGRHRAVQGWLTTEAAMAITRLAVVQDRLGVRGGACEIGVHHGKLLILLELLMRPDERVLAVDLFEQQGENVDGSGAGSRTKLTTNLARHARDPGRVELLACNSLQLTSARIQQSTGPVRLFSVDGGHTAEITYSDLNVAAEAVCENGLVILDDYLSSEWPGVTEGACRFMLAGKLNPVGYVSNKFVMVRGDSAPFVAALGGDPQPMFGKAATVVRHKSFRMRLAKSPVWTAARDRWIGRVVRRLAH